VLSPSHLLLACILAQNKKSYFHAMKIRKDLTKQDYFGEKKRERSN
jgi:hypothetical protein